MRCKPLAPNGYVTLDVYAKTHGIKLSAVRYAITKGKISPRYIEIDAGHHNIRFIRSDTPTQWITQKRLKSTWIDEIRLLLNK